MSGLASARSAIQALILVLGGGCAHQAPPAAPTGAPGAPIEAPPALPPVHFSQGSSRITDSDQQYLTAARSLLLGNPSLSVTLVGHTDQSGDEASNRALSVARAEFVRDQLVAGGAPADRIAVSGVGEAGASGNDVEDRRVDFAFARVVPATTPVPAPAPAPVADVEKPAKAAKADKSAAPDAPERDPMKTVGITDLDAFFGKVQAIRDHVWKIQDQLISARTSLTSALGVAEGTTLDSALGTLLQTAQGSLSLTFSGVTPHLAVKNNPAPEVQTAVDAVNGMITACTSIAAELPKLQTDAMALVEQAKALPAQVPTMAKDAGASPTQIPKMLGAVKTDVALTTKLPDEIKALLDEGVSTVNLVKSSFSGN